MIVYEYTKKQYDKMKVIPGVGFTVIEGKYFLPKDFVDSHNLEKGVEKDITP